MKFEAPEPRRFARRMGNGLVDAADMPSFKEDVVAFRVAGVGIALQDEHRSNEILEHFNDYQVLRQLRNEYQRPKVATRNEFRTSIYSDCAHTSG